ncbi:reverse transcriptase [Cooperia oncophora]
MARITRRKANTPDVGESIPLPTRHGVSQECTMVNEDFDKLSVSELLSSIIETNKDPIIGKMLMALSDKISNSFSDYFEREKRSRSIVIAGVEESKRDLAPSARQNELETTVARILDALDVECRPCEVFRMGKLDPMKPRLVKVVLPTVTHWRRALGNAKCLRQSGKSMTLEERKQDFELRRLAREKNGGSSSRDWVVFRGQVKHVSELPRRNSPIVDGVRVLPPLATSDHSMLSFSVDASLPPSHVPLPKPDFLRTDYTALGRSLSEVDWVRVFDGYTSASDLYRRFCFVVYRSLFSTVPFRYPRTSWNTRLSDVHQIHYAIDSIKKEGQLASRSLKHLFLYVNNKIKSNSRLPSIVDGNGCFCHSDGSKAVALGDYFATSFSSQSSSYTGLHCSELDFHYTCDNIYFHPSDVYELLKHLKPSTSEPYDGIPPIVFRKCASSLSGPLAHIFNVSFMMAEVPELWKEALVTAIPKVLHAQSVGDFRPISLTSTPAKVMEKIIRGKLLSWCRRFRIIPPEQHGFLPGASTTTNLVESVFDWCLALNQESITRSYYEFLIGLGYVAVCGGGWSLTYVPSGLARVSPIGTSAPVVCHRAGVLSPLLFLLYTIELPKVVNTSVNVKVQVYADDVKLYGIYDDKNRDDVCAALKQSVEKLNHWAASLDLAVNLNKCCVLHIGSGAAMTYEALPSNVMKSESSRIFKSKLKEIDLVRVLGVDVHQ